MPISTSTSDQGAATVLNTIDQRALGSPQKPLFENKTEMVVAGAAGLGLVLLLARALSKGGLQHPHEASSRDPRNPLRKYRRRR